MNIIRSASNYPGFTVYIYNACLVTDFAYRDMSSCRPLYSHWFPSARQSNILSYIDYLERHITLYVYVMAIVEYIALCMNYHHICCILAVRAPP